MREETPVIIVDAHGETTSEKMAIGRYLDGRVSAVLGTHTHVQTADEQIFENGTAFICDAGMCGPVHSIWGARSSRSWDVLSPTYRLLSRWLTVKLDCAGCWSRLNKKAAGRVELRVWTNRVRPWKRFPRSRLQGQLPLAEGNCCGQSARSFVLQKDSNL
jgi:hypothetical protein